MIHRQLRGTLRNRMKELRQRIAHCFSVSPHLALRRLRFHVNGSTVTLWGRVNSELQKSAAERCVRDVPGVDFVYNRIQLTQNSAGQFVPRSFNVV